MQIRKVELHNWCQLSGTYEFHPGLNAIRGPNGSGKTNLVNALVFSFTGDLSRLPGVKADNISFFAKQGEKKAWVKTFFTHNKIEACLKRSLPTGQELVIEGRPEKITRDAEIRDALETILGVNERMLLDYVFVPQWGIFKFVDQQPTVRARALAELFGAEKAQEIYTAMGEISIDIPSPSVSADIVKARLKNSKAELVCLDINTTIYANLPEDINVSLNPHREIIEKAERNRFLTGTGELLEKRKHSLEMQYEGFKVTVGDVAATTDELAVVVTDTLADYEQANRVLDAWVEYKRAYERKAILENEIEKLQGSLATLKQGELKRPSNYVAGGDRRVVESTLADLTAESNRYVRLVNNLKTLAPGSVECPTCGTSVQQIRGQTTDYQNKLEKNKPVIAGLTNQLRVSDAYNVESRQHADTTQRLLGSIAQLEQQLSSAPLPVKPTSSELYCKTLVIEYSAAKRSLEEHQNTLKIGEAKLQQMQAELIPLHGLIVTNHAERLLNKVEEGDEDRARKSINELTSTYLRRDQFRNRKRDLERLISDDEESLDRLEVENLRAAHLRQTAAHLDEVREVWRQMPRIVSQHHLEATRNKMNDILELFNARFRVEAIDDLRYLLRYHSGKIQPAERLSGGERVVFALAFRIVINSRFADELGLLCLDEPTAGLDEDNLACLEVAIGRLREMSHASGLQVILVTHETGLEGLFDHVIRLKAAS